jgi:glycosyltransferase involved in cell wall biosynthesis
VRVLIDTTYAGRGPTGTGIYVDRLTAALREAGVVVITTRNRWRRAPGGTMVRSLANYLSDRAWTTVALPWIAWRRGIDAIHHPLPAHAPVSPCPQIVTVHDLAFVRRPQLFAPRYARWAARAHRAAARRADAVVCVSEATREDVLVSWRIEPGRLVVAHHGAGQLEGADVRRTAARHFLYVGDAEPRKNVGVLLDAYGSYRAAGGDAPLVLAGNVADPVSPGVEIVSRPSRDRLAELHAGAIALVHPAIEEGFGLTLLEALAAGTPVLAVRSRAALEVCGDAAQLLDPGDSAALTSSLAEAMSTLAREPELRERLATAGLARSREFSWAASARAHIKAYTLALR